MNRAPLLLAVRPRTPAAHCASDAAAGDASPLPTAARRPPLGTAGAVDFSALVGVSGACAYGFSVMGDAGAEGEAPRCVGCGRRVKTLFVQYSPGNIRLMKCDNCKAVADPYIECEFMIILIDLILHKTRAYRHLLFNELHIGSSLDKGILYQSILVHIVLDAFRISVSKGHKADRNSTRSTLSTIFSCSEVLGDALLGNIIFMAILLLGVRYILKLSFDIMRYREVLLAVIISSYFKLFLLTMMVWEFPSSAIFIVEIFVLSSNVVALRVMTQFPKAHCVGVCFAAHAAKHLTERWLLRTP